MDKKKLIQISIIVICFLTAGFIVYNGMFKSSASVPVPTAGGTSQGINNAIPVSTGNTVVAGGKGNVAVPVSIQQLSINYDFSKEIKKVLLKNGLSYQTFQYPKVNEAEVGISVNDLVKPMAEK